MSDLVTALRARGMRLTAQRRRIVAALGRLGHATPDGVAAEVARDGEAAVAASTIYRGLEALEELGIVAHTHLDRRAPTYHLAGHADHIHLVCVGCGVVDEVPVASASSFVGAIAASRGFRADISHLAVHGRCAGCEGHS
ncbi:MAG: transcriptional repressor [Actinomycetales bacterium]|nr:transcriptional repressor [Actinomycetales bacterium]